MSYTEPTSADTTGIFEFLRYINNTADGLFFPVIILVIWIVAFITTLFTGGKVQASKSWLFASFLSSILLIPLVVIDLVSQRYMYMSFVLLGIGIVWIILEGSNE